MRWLACIIGMSSISATRSDRNCQCAASGSGTMVRERSDGVSMKSWTPSSEPLGDLRLPEGNDRRWQCGR